MQNKEKKLARRYDTPYRCHSMTEIVYSGFDENKKEKWDQIHREIQRFDPAPSKYQVFFGELHGHCGLSDGQGTPDSYFTAIRDDAGLDFVALTDHDHGGVAGTELWGKKWEQIKDAVKRYYEPGKFTTILAYEKDAYPWFNNAIVYYDNHDGEMLRGAVDGEMSREELHSYLKREDVLLVPHDTNTLSAGTDFLSLDLCDMPPLTQVYSRDNYAEKSDPRFLRGSDCEGGHWQDALNKGARMGCIAGSDDHDGNNGKILPKKPYPQCFPGMTGVWATENTLPAIFEALKARRCFAFMGGRISLDFRLNGHYMGEEIVTDEERTLYYNVQADCEIDTVTLVKNGRDYLILQGKSEQTFFDYRQENPTDYYYIRALLKDGRMAWSSPIWVNTTTL
ncbi:MAG: DUF3604 domain-containing protein [Clostridia bacterium]|nr:DUF3604 domain-containing protein [Clostridia bacterium]